MMHDRNHHHFFSKVSFIIHAKYIFEIMFGTAAYEYIIHQLQHEK